MKCLINLPVLLSTSISTSACMKDIKRSDAVVVEVCSKLMLFHLAFCNNALPFSGIFFKYSCEFVMEDEKSILSLLILISPINKKDQIHKIKMNL